MLDDAHQNNSLILLAHNYDRDLNVNVKHTGTHNHNSSAKRLIQSLMVINRIQNLYYTRNCTI